MSGPLSNPFMFNSAAADDFYDHQIAQSVRMQMSAGSRFRRTPSSNGNRQTWAVSMGVKRSKLGDEQFLFEAGASGGASTRLRLVINNDDKILITTGDANLVESSGVLRDINSWYHIHWKNTGGTNTVHVNGVQFTTVSISGDTAVNSTVVHGLGCRGGTGDDTDSSWDGYIAEFLLFDGTAYSYTDVTDEKNGVLIPADPSGLTLDGENSAWLKFQTAADMDDDSSGNTNDWTASNIATHDQMKDSPTFSTTDGNGGNFPTWNSIDYTGFNNQTLAEANLKLTLASTTYAKSITTMGAKTGKYYWETFIETQAGGADDFIFIGVSEKPAGSTTDFLGKTANSAGWYTNDSGSPVSYLLSGNTNAGAVGDSDDGYAEDDIIACALDLDASTKTIAFYKNGSAIGSAVNLPAAMQDMHLLPAASDYANGGGTSVLHLNC